jgi:hypothetical protein
MMAPSLKTSITSLLLLGLASPVRKVVDLISQHQAWKRRHEEMEASGDMQKTTATSSNPSYTPVWCALASLATTSASFLVSNSPIQSMSVLPTLFTVTISPPKQQDMRILNTAPSTELEAQLQDALQASNAIVKAQKSIITAMQAQSILQSMYLEGVRGTMQAQEEKKSKKRKTENIKMDGRCKILTQADIIEGVKEWHDDREKVAEEVAAKKKEKEKYSSAMDVWKVQEMDRKARNTLLKGGWEQDVKKWTIERDNAKHDHRKPKWTKPKMPMMEKAIRKPMVADFSTEDEDMEDEDEDEGDGDGDGDVQMAHLDGDSDVDSD